MKYRRRHHQVIFVAVLLISVAMAGKEPKWITELPYRPDLLQGVGVANSTGNPEKDRQTADDAAVAQIIHEISTSVSSNLVSYYSEQQTDDNIEINERVESFTEQYAKATIKGISIQERYFDKKLNAYYAYAVLSRDELEQQFAESAEAAIQLSADYHRFAQKALAEKNIATAIRHYSKALSEVMVVQANIKNRIEGKISSDSPVENIQSRLETELSNIIGSLKFETISGSDQKAVRNRALPEPLVGKVTYNNTPVKNLPLSLKFINCTGTVAGTIITNENGIFSASVTNIESAVTEKCEILAVISLNEIEPLRSEAANVFSIAKQKGSRFFFQIETAASIKAFVHILEIKDGEIQSKSLAAPQLIRQLIANKFSVIDKRRLPSSIDIGALEMAIEYGDFSSIIEPLSEVADYAIVGTITANPGDVSNNVLYFSKSDVDVRGINLKTGKIIANSSANGVKGAGNDYDSAMRLSLKKASDELIEELVPAIKAAFK